MPQPLRTIAFTRLEQLLSRPIEDVQDFPARREARARLQRSRAGRALFGTPDPGVETFERTVRIDGRLRRVLVHRPHAGTDLPAVLNLHGGGWVQGHPEQSAWFASRVAARTGAVVVSPEYRLAPEEPFPAAVEDSWSALEWLADEGASLDADPTRLAVMGDSAGGGLAATVALLARDAGGPALRAQILLYPGVEAYDRWPSEDEHARAAVLTSRNMRAFVRFYLGEEYGTTDWRASPIRHVDHRGLPPTLVVVAGRDPLADNGRRYAERLGSQGVHVRLEEFGDAVHGFASLPGVQPRARAAVRVAADFLGQHL
ncbi:alpha/beta hydrolase [Aeromicrobium sp. CTD01-1L150]|uniref:alpha/beta hydrolase n=1 Tax=Aeromicrobium sp. CTD01-1L150 TaxID=3341830 RepID=UPI0035C030BE